MKILFIVPYVPSLIRVRPYNLIRYLSTLGHQVHVLTVWSNKQERDDVERLRQHCAQVQAVYMPRWRSFLNCLEAIPGAEPLQAAYCWQEQLFKLAKDIPADVIHVEHLRGARYGLHLQNWQTKLKAYTPVVWDSVDSISLLFRQAAAQSKRLVSRWITRFELARTEHYEAELVNRFDQVLVTSPADKKALQALQPNNAAIIEVLPNGVDLDYFEPDPTEVREPATLVISGKMSYHANVTMVMNFAQNIFPRIVAHCPEVKLWVVGKDPTSAIRALAENPAITVTGTVDDIRPYLRRATIAIAPIAYGVGIQNKVLEAMGCGTPVVATSQAVSALEAWPGHDVLVANHTDEFADQVVALLGNAQQQYKIGQAGRRYVETHHDWAKIAARLEGIYHGVAVRV
jgi:sugar transferase (PEP-CTERM/EpsH1 system associated)